MGRQGIANGSYHWLFALVLLACGNTTENGKPTATAQTSGTTSTTTTAGSSDDTSTSSAGGTQASGGTSTGAAGAGGFGGDDSTGGATASGGAAGAPAEEIIPCQQNSDCVVVDDCCRCGAVSSESQVDECAIDCEVSRCSEMGQTVPSAVCHAGRCRLDVSCNISEATCRADPPSCPPGELPEVVDDCYTGRCFDARQCIRVASCNDCPEGDACVHMQSFNFSFLCAAPVSGCELNDCECMQACDGFGCAEGMESDLACYCPAC